MKARLSPSRPVVLAAAATVLAVACVVAAASPPAAPSAVRSTAESLARTSSPLRTLLVEPAAGLEKIYESIAAAKRSIDLEMYELADPEAESLLVQAASRGVNVRVVLDRNLEGPRNAAAYGYLTSHHVSVHWAPPGFAADHEKAMVVDTDEAWIMTLNFTSAYYANTRDVALLDAIPADVHAVVATFDHDFAGKSIDPSDGSDLVWSPTNASGALLSLIAGARSSLWVENEEMSDTTIVDALITAARRGVAVHVVMNDTSEYAKEFDTLAAGGAKVATYPGDPGLYIHAKVVVADPATSYARAFVGSENFSFASLLHNRELGITTRSAAVVSALAATVEHDFAGAVAWRAPAPAPSAWCKASAAPANDGYPGDYTVSIHSNQPRSEATASDANDRYAHETSTAGSAYLTLWHQSPGERITVTVGSAHCSTTA